MSFPEKGGSVDFNRNHPTDRAIHVQAKVIPTEICHLPPALEWDHGALWQMWPHYTSTSVDTLLGSTWLFNISTVGYVPT